MLPITSELHGPCRRRMIEVGSTDFKNQTYGIFLTKFLGQTQMGNQRIALKIKTASNTGIGDMRVSPLSKVS